MKTARSVKFKKKNSTIRKKTTKQRRQHHEQGKKQQHNNNKKQRNNDDKMTIESYRQRQQKIRSKTMKAIEEVDTAAVLTTKVIINCNKINKDGDNNAPTDVIMTFIHFLKNKTFC